MDDFAQAGLAAKERWPDVELFLVPPTPFDSLLRDLVGIPAYQIAERLGKPVWLVYSEGHIDTLLAPRLDARRRLVDSPGERTPDPRRLSSGLPIGLAAALGLLIVFVILILVGVL